MGIMLLDKDLEDQEKQRESFRQEQSKQMILENIRGGDITPLNELQDAKNKPKEVIKEPSQSSRFGNAITNLRGGRPKGSIREIAGKVVSESFDQDQEPSRLSSAVNNEKKDDIVWKMVSDQTSILDFSEAAGLLIDDLDDYTDNVLSAENAYMLSEVLNINIFEAGTMEPHLIRQMYGEELRSLRERYREKPIEGGFFSKMGEALKRGNENVSADIAVYEETQKAMETGNWDRVRSVIDAKHRRELGEFVSPIESNAVTNLFYKSAEIVPGMARGYWEAVPGAFTGMMTGIATAAAAGQTGPQIVLPEEAITVPAGASIGLRVGFAAGAAGFWYKQGYGSMMSAMMDKGYDPETSANVAAVAAIPYAAIELSQASKLTPGLRKKLLDSTGKTMIKVVARAVKRYGTTFTSEVIEEIEQEIVAISAEDIAGLLSDADIKFDKEFFRERTDRVLQTAKEASQAIALLPSPGIAIDIHSGFKFAIPTIEQKRITELVKEAETELKEKFGMTEGESVEEIETKLVDAAGESVEEGVSTLTTGIEAEEKRLISKDAYETARNRIISRDKLKTGINPQDFADLLTVGAYHVETGIRNFAKWSAKMVDEFGEKVKPQLKEIWTQVSVDRGIAERAKVAKTKPSVKVEKVLPKKIISPGQAGPFKITLPGTKQVAATRIITDPKVARSVQARENQVADLKNKLRQAKYDKKNAVVESTEKAIEKMQVKIDKLKAQSEIKVSDSIEHGRIVAQRLITAHEFKDSMRRQAIAQIRAIPKDIQKDFILEASRVTTAKGLQNIGERIQRGIERIEKKQANSDLKKAIKAIKPKRMLPEFAEVAQNIVDSIALGKPTEDTKLKLQDLKDMAQQVLDTAEEDSIAWYQSQQLIEDLRGQQAKTFSINKLSIDSINQLTDTLIALRFQNEADTIAAKGENSETAGKRREEVLGEITESPDVVETLPGATLKKFNMLHTNLESLLDAVAGARSGAYKLWVKNKRAFTEYVYDVINSGVDEQIRHNHKARNIFRQIIADNGATGQDILVWSMRPSDISIVKRAFGFGAKPVVHKFKLQDALGKTQQYEFTVSELMSILMHSRNNHNLAVLLRDGMNRIQDKKKQKIRGFTYDIIDEMTSVLTDQQKNIAKQVGSKLMDGLNRDAINKVSIELEFYELAKVGNYWPARRSITQTVKGKQLNGPVKTIEGMGLLKERVGTANPMKLNGFFETVFASNKNVAAYVGLAKPMREVKSVYNADVVESLEDHGRSDEAKLLNTLITKIEGETIESTPLDRIVSRMIGGFAKSKLFLNAKIAPRQYISMQLLGAYVDPQYFAAARGIINKKILAEIDALSPQLGSERIEGLQFDRDVGDAMANNAMMNYLTGDVSLLDKTALGMRYFDSVALADVYRIVKAEIHGQNPDLDINSNQGQSLLKDRFEWVARHTQPMWHPKDRSQLGSTQKPLVRLVTMFMSQREQLVRMVNNSIIDYAHSEKTAADTVRLARVMGTVATNMALFTLYNFAWIRFVKKRDRDLLDLTKMYFKDILSIPFFGGYFATGFEALFNSTTGKPNYNKTFREGAVEGILQDLLLVAIPNYSLAAKHFINGDEYSNGDKKWKAELLVAADATLEAVASLKGVPYYGAKDIVGTVVKHVTDDEKKNSHKWKGR